MGGRCRGRRRRSSPADGEGERLEGEPKSSHAATDDGVGEGVEEVGLPDGRATARFSGPADPLESIRAWVAPTGWPPGSANAALGVEGLAGGELDGGPRRCSIWPVVDRHLLGEYAPP